MTHLECADVADFVRGTATPADRDRMERHLGSGCERCRRAVSVMQAVAAIGRADARWEPPAGVVRIAAAIMPRPVEPRQCLLARLVFDSFSQPLPVGVRSVHRRSRQLMYRAGGFYVDLRVDHEQNPRRVSLVGQVASCDVADPAPAEALLVDGGHPIVVAPVNEFGEFQLEYTPGPRVRLRIPLAGDEVWLDVPLAGRGRLTTARPPAAAVDITAAPTKARTRLRR